MTPDEQPKIKLDTLVIENCKQYTIFLEQQGFELHSSTNPFAIYKKHDTAGRTLYVELICRTKSAMVWDTNGQKRMEHSHCFDATFLFDPESKKGDSQTDHLATHLLEYVAESEAYTFGKGNLCGDGDKELIVLHCEQGIRRDDDSLEKLESHTQRLSCIFDNLEELTARTYQTIQEVLSGECTKVPD